MEFLKLPPSLSHGLFWLHLLPALAEDQLWCSKALGEWGSGGSFQWQYHGAGRTPTSTRGIASSSWAWIKLLELSQAPLGNRGDKREKNPLWVSDVLFLCTVSCSGPAVPCAEERPPGSQQDAQQVHTPWPQVPICLLHDDPNSQQAAGGGGWQVSRLLWPAERIYWSCFHLLLQAHLPSHYFCLWRAACSFYPLTVG